MADLLDLSARIIDSGVADQPVNRVTNELTELTDDLAIVESFSHSIAVRTADGIVAFDASGVHTIDRFYSPATPPNCRTSIATCPRARSVGPPPCGQITRWVTSRR